MRPRRPARPTSSLSSTLVASAAMFVACAIQVHCAAATPPRAANQRPEAIASVILSSVPVGVIVVDGHSVGTNRADMVTYLKLHHVRRVRFRSQVKRAVLQEGVCDFYSSFREADVDIIEFIVPTSFRDWDWAGRSEKEFCPTEALP